MSALLVFDVLAPVPSILDGFRTSSIIGRAVTEGIIELNVVSIRDFATDKHRLIDDRPFGGGAGMVLKPEPLFAAIESRLALTPPERTRLVLLSPQGRTFRQEDAGAFAEWALAGAEATAPPSGSSPTTTPLALTPPRLIFLCGRYEGIDERVIAHFRPEAISIGDFVIAGGEVAAMVVIEAVARLLPGVCGNSASLEEESFGAAAGGGLEYPQYTRPAVFRGYEVPEVLQNGHHAQITAWRKAESERRTRERRPDLKKAPQAP